LCNVDRRCGRASCRLHLKRADKNDDMYRHGSNSAPRTGWHFRALDVAVSLLACWSNVADFPAQLRQPAGALVT
jgi:hypothetical protein